LDFLGKVGPLALELIQRLVWLLAQKFLGSIVVTVQTVEAQSAGLLAFWLATWLALEDWLSGEADLVLVAFGQSELVESLFGALVGSLVGFLVGFGGRVGQTVGHATVVGASLGALDDLVAVRRALGLAARLFLVTFLLGLRLVLVLLVLALVLTRLVAAA